MTKKDPTKREDFERLLYCELTDEEIGQKALDAVAADRELRDLAREKRNWLENWKERAGGAAADKTAAITCVETRQEERRVPCERVWDFDAGPVIEVRLDTGEEIHTRPITAEERQTEIA